MPNRRYYAERELKESTRIWREEQKGVGDRDIHNLEMILYSIKPGSKWFNAGCISSLRRAIKALEAENNEEYVNHLKKVFDESKKMVEARTYKAIL